MPQRPSNPRKRPNPRKLLVASVGVATLNYIGACSDDRKSTVANLLAIRPDAGKDAGGDADARPSPTVANLVAPPPTVANLLAPPPPGIKDGGR